MPIRPRRPAPHRRARDIRNRRGSAACRKSPRAARRSELRPTPEKPILMVKGVKSRRKNNMKSHGIGAFLRENRVELAWRFIFRFRVVEEAKQSPHGLIAVNGLQHLAILVLDL